MSPPTDPERVRLAREALVGRLLPDLVHQLRNPVNSILTGAALLQDKGEQPEMRAKLLPVLLRSAEALRTLLGEADEWSGPAPDGGFDLRMALSEALSLLRSRRHTVVVHPPQPGAPLLVRGESSLLWILLLLLLEETKCLAAHELWIEVTESPSEAKLTLENDEVANTAAIAIPQTSRDIAHEVAQELGCTIVREEPKTAGGRWCTVVTFPKQVDQASEGREP